MSVTRRLLLAAGGIGLVAAGSGRVLAAEDPALTERSIGWETAPVTVGEYFSLTCTHCAAFAREVFPTIKAQLIDTGKIKYVFRDFPLDQVALKAAMVARSLPADRYEPFILALLASQERWAFTQGANTTDELAKIAALAGMPRALFDAAISNEKLKQAITNSQNDASKRLAVDSTPTFIFNGPKSKDVKQAGEMDFANFSKHVADAG